MIKKTIKFIWSVRYQLSKYFVVGISAVILDVGTLFIFKEYFGLQPVIAVVVNQIFIINYVFFLNKRWSFKVGGVTHKQMMRFYMLAVTNYFFSVLWMYVLNQQFVVHYLIARVANIALAVGWNFLLYKYWVYRQDSGQISSTSTSNEQ